VLQPFWMQKGRRAARCDASRRRRSVFFVLRKKKAGWGPCGSERRGGVGWAGQEAKAYCGGGERFGWGGREVATTGPKTTAGPKFKK
jgi:hypothetical protein